MYEDRMTNQFTGNFAPTIDPADVIVVILGGGHGSRLFPLTKIRAKPAVSFGGKYRLIDIPITNCLKSHVNKIFILTQYNSFSLNRHIWQAYSSEIGRGGFIDVIAEIETDEIEQDNKRFASLFIPEKICRSCKCP